MSIGGQPGRGQILPFTLNLLFKLARKVFRDNFRTFNDIHRYTSQIRYVCSKRGCRDAVDELVQEYELGIVKTDLYQGTAARGHAYLSLLVIDQRLHMHVPDIRMVSVVVCQGSIVRGEKG